MVQKSLTWPRYVLRKGSLNLSDSIEQSSKKSDSTMVLSPKLAIFEESNMVINVK